MGSHPHMAIFHASNSLCWDRSLQCRPHKILARLFGWIGRINYLPYSSWRCSQMWCMDQLINTCWYSDPQVEEAARRKPGKAERGWKKKFRMMSNIVIEKAASTTSTASTVNSKHCPMAEVMLNVLDWENKVTNLHRLRSEWYKEEETEW